MSHAANASQLSPPIDGARAAPTGPALPTFRRLASMFRPYSGWLLIAIILLLLSMPCDLFPAFIWQYVTDDLLLKGFSQPSGLNGIISIGGRISGIGWLLIAALAWLTVIYVVGEVLGSVSTVLMQWVTQKFIYQFRNRVYARLQGQSLGYLHRQRTGDLMSRVMGDVDEIQNFIINSIDVIIGEGVLWMATIGVLFWKAWKVTAVSLAPLLLVYLLLRIFNKKVQPIYIAARAANGNVSTRLQENLGGVMVIKIFGRERRELKRFDDATADYYHQQMKAVVARNTFFPFARAVGFFSMVFMLGFGAFSIMRDPHGPFTVGILLMFRAYWWRLFGPVISLARVNDMVQRAKAAGRRIFEVMDAPDELPDSAHAVDLTSVTGELDLRDVDFRYPVEIAGKPQPLVLQDVNLKIRPGQTVALCGPSGAGKSTALQLLMRFYDPVSGQVLLDGKDLRDIRRESFTRHFALVQQETFLFNDSVLDNIRYGHPEATLEQVANAARAANAHGFISRLPAGYDTKVGERGVRLSGGQKQRISIARAFLANPTILLLDEPTSSVEPDSEVAIVAALDRLMAGRTTILTSHRPSLIQQADLVYVIEDGRITQRGSPEELAREGGWFARFLRSHDDADSPLPAIASPPSGPREDTAASAPPIADIESPIAPRM